MDPTSTAEPVTDTGLSDEAIAQALMDSGEDVARFFSYAHLPERLRNASRSFARLAAEVVLCFPFSRERTKALDALLIAKDCAVRSLIAKAG